MCTVTVFHGVLPNAFNVRCLPGYGTSKQTW